MNRFEKDFHTHVAKPLQRSKTETRAHYEGELAKLHQQQLEALMACRKRRPCLAFDAMVRLVNWETDQSISDKVIQKFKEECRHG